ncbi:hypothetical protein [Streptomyces sp. NPDC094049]
MFCEHCGDSDGAQSGVDHDERDCPWLNVPPAKAKKKVTPKDNKKGKKK